jgi:hypothetical protein
MQREHKARVGWARSVAVRRSCDGGQRAMRQAEGRDYSAQGLGLHEVEGVRLQQG